ncbi:MAG: hypothetical protein WC584_03190 [Candidatus Pacearchaeota archaeon]
MGNLKDTKRREKESELERKINSQNSKLMIDQIGFLASGIAGGLSLYTGANHENLKYAVVSAGLVGVCGFAIRWYKHSKELNKLYNELCNL